MTAGRKRTGPAFMLTIACCSVPSLACRSIRKPRGSCGLGWGWQGDGDVGGMGTAGGPAWGWQGDRDGRGMGIGTAGGQCLQEELSPDLRHQRAGATARCSHEVLPCSVILWHRLRLVPGYFCRTSGFHSLGLRSPVFIS